jgi:hypothetical protein
MPQPKSMDERISAIYYTASEARTVLGMSKDSFNYWVKTGKIQKRSFMGKHGYYAKKEIDGLAAKIEAMMFADTPEPLTFRRGTVDDLDAETHLAYLIFGQRALDPEFRAARRAYLENCPDSDWHLYDNERLVAYVNIVSVSDEAVKLFKTGRHHAWSFTEELRPYTPGHQHKCIIADFVTIPSAPPAQRSSYAQRMLSELGHVLKDFGARGIEITALYAASSTPSGIRILKHAGFIPMETEVKDRLIYEMDVAAASHIRMLQDYKEALTEWQASHQQQPATASHSPPASITAPTTRKPSPRSSQPQIQASSMAHPDLPAGTLTLREFANELGIHRATLAGAIGDAERKFQRTGNEGDRIAHEAFPKPGRPNNEMDRYFTPAQQAAYKNRPRRGSRKQDE